MLFKSHIAAFQTSLRPLDLSLTGQINVSAGAITGNNFYNDTTGLRQATEIYRSQVSGATTTSQTGLTDPNAVVVTNSGTYNTGTITGSAADAGAVTSACAGTTSDGIEVDGDAASCNAPANSATAATPTTPRSAEATPATATEQTPSEEPAPASGSTGGGGINF